MEKIAIRSMGQGLNYFEEWQSINPQTTLTVLFLQNSHKWNLSLTLHEMCRWFKEPLEYPEQITYLEQQADFDILRSFNASRAIACEYSKI